MKKETKAIQRVFVSSTYEDMREYREVAIDALTSVEQLPVGMDHFMASNETPLDVCLANVRRCQLLILLIGMRYGSIDNNTGKSYTELEYEEALRNDIPVLAFIMDETQCPVLPIYVDVDEKAAKLKIFKQRLKDTKYAAMFVSKDDLRNRITLAVKNHFEDDNNKCAKKQNDANEKKYLEGAKLYRKFLLVPERLKNTEVLLRVRMDGQFANNFIRRDELFDAYKLKKGDTVVAESVIPVGIDYSDINNDAAYLDLYAEGKHADWIIDNGITTGVIFEGRFKLVYELIEGVAQNKANSKPFASKIPALILIEGLSVIGKSNDEGYAIKRNTGWETLFEG